ncbi:polysaccharide biosynthesis/export family protein [Pelagicoccus albus]|uniref:Polysaccharide biosynthesis/export family protein n=1 Tax=Pelagicoccus albus TaxID=415222 RepID=A0A7X1E6U9_9BACT|nr:polysaccharide biosynthesis/export family protein [Pelagicoccus albus]MBC2605090.1 polysaccharide biosynthesis/export family protein [Pelagicoccus albus]
MNNQSFAVPALLSRFQGAFLKIFLLATILSVPAAAQSDGSATERFLLQPQDLVKIDFPGAPELNMELQVRRDGAITLPIVGEVDVAGMTPRELEGLLAEKFEDQLVSNEVIVSVIESHFTYYLEGEVRNPGIVESFRQLSVLEAIIAAGGIDKVTGKMKKIVVLRRKGGRYQQFELDLAAVIDGKNSQAFVLESYDIVSVPPRVW